MQQRSFAARSKSKPKTRTSAGLFNEVSEDDGGAKAVLRSNGQIKAKEVRLIDENGDSVGVVPIADALERAAAAGLDLVEVMAKLSPPVCRLLDLSAKEQRTAEIATKAAKAAKQQQRETKQLRLSPRTDDGQAGVKARQLAKMLRKNPGMRVEVFVHCKNPADRQSQHATAMPLLQMVFERVREEVAGMRQEGDEEGALSDAWIHVEPDFTGRHYAMVVGGTAPKTVVRATRAEQEKEKFERRSAGARIAQSMLSGGETGAAADEVSLELLLPEDQVGRVIGKKGTVLKQTMKQYSVVMEVARHSGRDKLKGLTISGRRSDVENCRQNVLSQL